MMPSLKVNIEELQAKYDLDVEGLIDMVKTYLPAFNAEKFRQAFLFAAHAHNGQMRKENKPYIVHPFEAARILASIQADEDTLIAALLHDVPEDTKYTIEDIKNSFGPNIAFLIEGITKISKVHYRHDMQERQIQSLKKMFVHMAQDYRTIIIKLADRLHNIRTLSFIDNPSKRARIAAETLEIFVPIAKLLGISELSLEMENSCFKELYYDEYIRISNRIEQMSSEIMQARQQLIDDISPVFSQEEIDICLIESPISYYSLYKKLLKDNKTPDELSSFINFKLILNTPSQCYRALGIIHHLYHPKIGYFKDYIAVPKINNYQALHTAVFGRNGVSIFWKIQTHEMLLNAQYGVASSNFDSVNDLTKQDHVNRLKNILEIDERSSGASFFLNDLKKDLLTDRITVFTPIGDTIDLPEGATCIDFAYSIHSEIGNSAQKAEVNNRSVKLNHKLHNGDTVKIILSNESKNPNLDWLNFAVTSHARNKIKEYFSRENRDHKIKQGIKILQKEYERLGLGTINTLPKWKIQLVKNTFPNVEINNFQDILANIGEGTVSSLELVRILHQDPKKPTIAGLKHLNQVNIRIKADPRLKVEDVIADARQLNLSVLSSNFRTGLYSKNLTCNITLRSKSIDNVVKFLEELENTDGIKRIRSSFQRRHAFFIISIISLFAIFVLRTLAVQQISDVLSLRASQNVLLSDFVLFVGFMLLGGIMTTFKVVIQKSIPELSSRQNNFALTTALMTFAALVFWCETELFRIQFDAIFIIMLAIPAFLSFAYMYFRRQEKII